MYSVQCTYLCHAGPGGAGEGGAGEGAVQGVEGEGLADERLCPDELGLDRRYLLLHLHQAGRLLKSWLAAFLLSPVSRLGYLEVKTTSMIWEQFTID